MTELSTREQLEKLLDQLEIDNPAVLNELAQAQLAKVKVSNAEKKWTFVIENQQGLSFSTYQLLHEQAKSHFAPMLDHVAVELKNDSEQIPDAELITAYWPAIIGRSGISKTALGEVVEDIVSDYDQGHLTLAVANKMTAHLLEDQLANLQQVLDSFGFQKVNLSVEVDLERQQSMIEEHRQRMQLEAQQAAEEQMAAARKAEALIPDDGNVISLGRQISADAEIRRLNDINTEENSVIVEGYVFDTDVRALRNGKKLLTLKLTDYSSSMSAKKFANDDREGKLFDQLKVGSWVRIKGRVQEDQYARELTITINDVQTVNHQNHQDEVTGRKRIELHVHTAMTTLSGINPMSDYVKRAKEWGHEAIAITDRASVQGFPTASQAASKNDLKVIYGMEANLVDDGEPIALNPASQLLNASDYVAFDIETTGLSAIYDRIIELSAVKFHNGIKVDEFTEFIDPGMPLSTRTIELTSITDEMVRGSKTEQQVLEAFREFSQDTILVGHNVTFDLGFLNVGYQRFGAQAVSNPVINTLPFARAMYPDFKSYQLGRLAKRFDIELEQAHRAIFDAETTGLIALKLINESEERFQTDTHQSLNTAITTNDAWRHARPSHATVLVKSAVGLKNLYKIVSLANVMYFHRVPRVPREVLNQYREGLLVGTGDQEGEVFEAMLDKGYEEAKALAQYYDYIEIQPLATYQPLIDDDRITNEGQLKQLIQQFIKLGDELDKPVVVTGNTHYLDPEGAPYRKILISAQPGNRENRYELAKLHLRSTQELLEDFSFLDDDVAQKIVVDNTHLINDQIDKIEPLKKGSYRPKMEGADDEIQERTYSRAHELYGKDLPIEVSSRLEKELHAIIKNRFSVIYLISQRLVAKSNKDGYLVGSRGSVGSSLVATMLGITEVNPLPPHYRSAHGDYTEFAQEGNYESGYDLPLKEDPNHPGELLIGDGQNIPFETFLGFKGDKTPDIDLNFSGDYQPIAHNYTKVMFGEHNVFRAGTISTVAEQTAYGYVKGYERDHDVVYRNAEEDRLARGIVGIKRTTGQHPGGILIVPKIAEVDGEDVPTEIYDFTPIQYPADKPEAAWQTTHLDYHSIHDNLLKMDILGHDDPTMLRTLQDLTGIDPKTIPVNDEKVMSLFTSTEALDVDPKAINSKTGALGIPEFGTNFVRGMLDETHPKTYSELLQISGLSHGTDVWRGNADELIKSGKANIGTVIGTRDKIMTDLIGYGLDPQEAFLIMEDVRKGKGVKPEYEQSMREHQVPSWYIDSANKIQYMFPRAHAAAYVLMALRIAYFKVYFPIIYYNAYFSVRGDDPFELIKITRGKEVLTTEINRIKSLGNEASVNEKRSLTLYELANEASERGIEFKMVDLYKSEATEWIIGGNQLIAPFAALPSLGESVAKRIIAARTEKPFLSKEDLQKRGNVNKTLIEFMDFNGILEGLPDENQLSLF